MNHERPACRANTKARKPCGAAPTSSGLCFFHSNPAKASELGRIGGRRNRRLRGEGAAVIKQGGADSALERLARLYDDVLNRRVRPAEANVLIKVTELQLKLAEKTDIAKLERGVEDLKQVIAKREIDAPISEDPNFPVEEVEEDRDDDSMAGATEP